jgi:hypothetical protein
MLLYRNSIQKINKMNHPRNLSTGVFILGFLTLTIAPCRADDAETSASSSPPSPFQPFTLGVEVGTTGAGGAADWRFSNHFGVGTAFDYFAYTYNASIENNNYDARFRLQSEPLTLNLYPSKNHSFHVSVGAFFNQNQVTGTAIGTAQNPITLNGYDYIGTVNLTIKEQPVNPYLTIGGNLYFDHGHHVSLGGQLGVAYTGEPRVSLSAPGAPPEDVQGEQNKIESYAKKLQFWPIIKLSLNYSF